MNVSTQETPLVKALIIRTDGTHEVREVEATLDTISLQVGGYIEAVNGNRPGWHCYVNEEGKLYGLPRNPLADALCQRLGWTPLAGDYLVGNAVFFGPPDEEGEETDVPDFVLLSLTGLVRDVS